MGCQEYSYGSVEASKLKLGGLIDKIATKEFQDYDECGYYFDRVEIKKDNLSVEELYKDLYNYAESDEGIALCYASACGNPVGYNIFKPVFKEIDWRDVFRDRDELLREKKTLGGSSQSYIIYLPPAKLNYFSEPKRLYGDHLKECKDYALDYIFNVPDKEIYIYNVKTNKVYMVCMEGKRVRTTSKKSIKGQYLVEPIYNWNYALTLYTT